MAKTRSLNTKIWKDEYFGELSPDYKLVFLYLLTNPATTISGAYEITKREIAFDTGLSLDCVSKAMECFESNGKITYKDGWVFVTNFIKHQSLNPKVLIGIRESLKHSPRWIIDRVKIGYDSLSIGYEAFNLNSNLNSNSKNKESNNPLSPPPKAANEKKGFRIPEDFYPSKEMIAYAREKVPNIDLETRITEFKNYWKAKTGKDATKHDWNLTFQNRIIQIADYQSKNGGKNGTKSGKKSNADVLQESADFYANYPNPA